VNGGERVLTHANARGGTGKRESNFSRPALVRSHNSLEKTGQEQVLRVKSRGGLASVNASVNRCLTVCHLLQ